MSQPGRVACMRPVRAAGRCLREEVVIGQALDCWNCQNALGEALLCSRCGMPQPIEFLGAFEALGLPPRLSLAEEELSENYDRLVRKCHPDLFRAHKDERVLTAARLAARTLNDALRELREPVSRLGYVLAATGNYQEVTRAVPEGLQASAQIVDRVLRTVEEAQAQSDRIAWEAEQDHLASLQVQTEAAEQRSNEIRDRLFTQWDAAVAAAGKDWPEVGGEWFEQAQQWLGERKYLSALSARMTAARLWVDRCEPLAVEG